MEYNFYLCGRSIECSTKGADGQNSSIVDKAAIQRGASLRKLLQNKYSLTIFIIADPAEIFDLVVSSPDPSKPGKFVPKKKALVMEPFHGDDFFFLARILLAWLLCTNGPSLKMVVSLWDTWERDDGHKCRTENCRALHCGQHGEKG